MGSLQARDTARIASVGTVMQLLEIDDRSIGGSTTWPGKPLPTHHRVVAHCRAVGIVNILSIEKSHDRDEDYLVAKVHVRHPPETLIPGNGQTEGDNFDSTAKQIFDDYHKVRSIYINSQSLASNELPTFDADNMLDETSFWKLAETWQMLCNTVRQAKQTMLQSFVNELSVAVAMRAKGPLELPVKRKNLPPEVQTQLNDMEQRAAQEFVELGMDPILDFQEILATPERHHRAARLARMISRERARLEAKESLIRAFTTREHGEASHAASTGGNETTVFD